MNFRGLTLTREQIAQYAKEDRTVRAIEGAQTDLTEIGNALTTTPFLTLSSDPSLGAERALVLTGDLTAVDAGANSTYTLGLSNTAVVPGVYGDASKTLSLTITSTGRITGAAEHTLSTTNVAEGANLYYTDARARAALSGTTGITYTSATGVIALDTANNRNVDHTGVTFTAGAGLTGGGDISANRTFDIGAGTGITVNANDVALTVPTASGTYTPTLTNVANLDASTAYACQYMRVGSVVTVSGRVDVDPTLAATSTALGITLPIASNFANTEELGGTAASPSVAGQVMAIFADAANNRANLQFVSGDIGNRSTFFQFTYQLI